LGGYRRLIKAVLACPPVVLTLSENLGCMYDYPNKGVAMKRCLLIVPLVILLAVIVLISSCVLNQNPPDYMKDVLAYKEGSDGLVIYFILADSSGQMTTADGLINLIISETKTARLSDTKTEVVLFSIDLV
jgi:hypothetical protein